MKTLIIGYGNPDRQDDGTAWHVLQQTALRLGLPVSDSWEDELPASPELEFRFYLQLMPEIAETVAEFERVCFVDAHTGQIAEPVRLVELSPAFQASPFTHHLTPETLLSLCLALYERSPQAALLSVRGYAFGFDQALSEQTAALLPQAVTALQGWLAY